MLSLPTLLLLALTLLHATSFHLSTTTRSISPLRISSDVETSTRVETTKESKNERLNRANKGLETHVVGLSIHHSSVDVREKLAVPESHWNEVSRALVDSGACSEAAIISTCNRFEVYFSSPNSRESMSKVRAERSEDAWDKLRCQRAHDASEHTMPASTRCKRTPAATLTPT